MSSYTGDIYDNWRPFLAHILGGGAVLLTAVKHGMNGHIYMSSRSCVVACFLVDPKLRYGRPCVDLVSRGTYVPTCATGHGYRLNISVLVDLWPGD